MEPKCSVGEKYETTVGGVGMVSTRAPSRRFGVSTNPSERSMPETVGVVVWCHVRPCLNLLRGSQTESANGNVPGRRKRTGARMPRCRALVRQVGDQTSQKRMA